MLISRLPSGEPEIFASIQGEGPTTGLASVFVRFSLCNLKCGWCFVPDTPVLMADGSWRPMDELAAGSAVIAMSRRPDGEPHPRLTTATVTRVLFRDAHTAVVNGALRCTPDHGFWATGTAHDGRRTRAGWRAVAHAVGTEVLAASEPFSPHRTADRPPCFGRVIEAVEPTGRREAVVNLTTTAGSFIAGGFVVKNCDTKYTWDWSQYDRTAEVVSLDPDDVVRRVCDRAGDGIRNVVLTGGEPMLQRDALAALASRLKAEGFRLEVETNGTFVPAPELAHSIDQWNVSPKLASSGNTKRSRDVPTALAWFAARGNAFWKFVVVEPEDLREIHALARRYGVPADRIIVMPEGTDIATLRDRSAWLAGACQEAGFRLGPRLHVLLWGSQRGR